PIPPPPTVRDEVRFQIEFEPDKTTAPVPFAPLSALPPTTAELPPTNAPALTCRSPAPFNPTATIPLLIHCVLASSSTIVPSLPAPRPMMATPLVTIAAPEISSVPDPSSPTITLLTPIFPLVACPPTPTP